MQEEKGAGRRLWRIVTAPVPAPLNSTCFGFVCFFFPFLSALIVASVSEFSFVVVGVVSDGIQPFRGSILSLIFACGK